MLKGMTTVAKWVYRRAVWGENVKQQSIFAFGVRKIVVHNDVRHEVVPTEVSNYEVNHPFSCKFDCGERFKRASGKATHERTCKRRRVL